MARIRTIKPEFPQSETVGKLSRDARLLYVQLWTIVDDSGRARAASRLLASLLYPYDDDAPGLIDGWLDELESTNCIQRYRVDGTLYLQVCSWSEHQKIDHPTPTKLPNPPQIREPVASPREDSRETRGASMLDLGPRTMDLGPSTNGSSGVDELLPPVVAPSKPMSVAVAANGAAPAGKRKAAPRAGATAAPRGRDDLFDAFLLAYDFDPSKPPPRVRGLAGDFAARCRRQSIVPTPADWSAWVAAQKREMVKSRPAWGTVTVMHNATERFLAWWGTKRSSSTPPNGYDPRFFFCTDDGRWQLKHPSLVTLDLPGYSPTAPSSWPPDMRAAYSARIHSDDTGAEFFA